MKTQRSGPIGYAFNPFENEEMVFTLGCHSNPSDLFKWRAVSKLWQRAITENLIWEKISEERGVPLVGGRGRNRKEDFQTLDSMTISGKRISKYLGEVIGPIPRIHESFMNILNCKDPMDPDKTIRDSYIFVVDPYALKRPLEGQKIFSYKTLYLFGKYNINGTKRLNAFEEVVEDAKVDETSIINTKTSILFMRKHLVPGTLDLTYGEQEEALDKMGFKVAPGLTRALALFIIKMEGKEDLETYVGQSFARSSEEIAVKIPDFRPLNDGCRYAISVTEAGLSIGNDQRLRTFAAAAISAELKPEKLENYLQQNGLLSIEKQDRHLGS